MRKFFWLFLLFITFLPVSISAQGIDEILNVQINPKYPGPGDLVEIKIESYSYDLNAAQISWLVDGVLERSGQGEKSFTLTAKQAGTTNVVIDITSQEGVNFRHEISITPASVYLTWEAQTFTPPFYQGKALYTEQSDLKIIALPELKTSSGQTFNPDSLIYTWKKSGRTMDGSGYGKRSIIIEGKLLSKPVDIAVEVSNNSGTITGQAEFYLAPETPQVLLYEESPTNGVVFEQAVLNEFDLSQKEITLQAVPYFFSVGSYDDLVAYDWRVNNGLSSGNSSEIVFRNEIGGEGRASISLDLIHLSKILQTASKNFVIDFKTPINSQPSAF